MRIVHISDTHFGTEVAAVEEAFWKCVSSLRPDLIIHSGDVTQRALDSEYQRAGAFMAKFGSIPQVVVPGNHDIPLWNLYARLVRPYAGFQRTFGDLEPCYEDRHTLVLGLNTTRWWRHKDGSVSDGQVERVAARIRNARAEQLRVVVAHHPIYVPYAHAVRDQLNRAQLAARAWTLAGVDLVLGGHIHLPYFATLPQAWNPIASASWVAQAGTATSRRIRSGIANSINVVERHATWYKLQRWDFHALECRFELGSSVNVPIRRFS